MIIQDFKNSWGPFFLMTKLVFVIVFVKEKIGGGGKIISYLENIGKLFKFKKLKHSKKKQNKIKLAAEAAAADITNDGQENSDGSGM